MLCWEVANHQNCTVAFSVAVLYSYNTKTGTVLQCCTATTPKLARLSDIVYVTCICSTLPADCHCLPQKCPLTSKRQQKVFQTPLPHQQN